jgi:hypothetical protein
VKYPVLLEVIAPVKPEVHEYVPTEPLAPPTVIRAVGGTLNEQDWAVHKETVFPRILFTPVSVLLLKLANPPID